MKQTSQSTRWKSMAALFVALVVAALTFGAPTVSASPSLDATETELCKLINEYRAANGLQPLLVSPDLNEASDWHTDDMVANNYVSHTDSLGRDPFTRMAAFGYNYATYKGENIAAGSSSASTTLNQWKNSAPHNANLLNANYKVMGLARSYGAGTTYGYYWNNTFGGYVDPGAEPCPGSTSASPSPSVSASPSAAPSPAFSPSVTPSPTSSPATVPAMSIDNVAIEEGNSGTRNLVFTVTLSAPASGPVTVNYATQDGTARAGSDYTATSGTLTIPAGQTSGTISVPVIGDRTREDRETFRVNLTNPSGATIADGEGVGRIRNDD